LHLLVEFKFSKKKDINLIKDYKFKFFKTKFTSKMSRLYVCAKDIIH